MCGCRRSYFFRRDQLLLLPYSFYFLEAVFRESEESLERSGPDSRYLIACSSIELFSCISWLAWPTGTTKWKEEGFSKWKDAVFSTVMPTYVHFRSLGRPSQLLSLLLSRARKYIPVVCIPGIPVAGNAAVVCARGTRTSAFRPA